MNVDLSAGSTLARREIEERISATSVTKKKNRDAYALSQNAFLLHIVPYALLRRGLWPK
jgi:hypothetical protein